MTTRQTITVGRQRFRVGPWHSDPSVAHLTVAPNGPRVDVEDVAACLDRLRAEGFTSVLTAALDAREAGAFEEVGFRHHDRLAVLVHDLSRLEEMPDPPQGIRLRRGRRGDREIALELDARAFPDFWRLDAAGLWEAETATPNSRFRVAVGGEDVLGYAVTGRGAQQGFLQRLAIDPGNWRGGIGSALVADGLLWCARRRCGQVFVNTQVDNQPALALYRRLGFRPTGADLVVLLWTGS